MRSRCAARMATVTAAVALLLLWPPEPQAKRPLTVADSIETTRILSGQSPGWVQSADGQWQVRPEHDVFVSPDGQSYVVLLVRGDLQRNGNWLEILTGDLTSMDRAATPVSIGRLFMTSLGDTLGHGTSLLTYNPIANKIVWLDGQRLAFLWGDAQNVSQVFMIDIRTHRLTQLTDHRADVTTFAAGPDGTLIYSALNEHSRSRDAQLLEDGFAVANTDLLSLLAGHVDGYDVYDRTYGSQLFIHKPNHPPKQLVLAGVDVNPWPTSIIRPASTGRKAVLDGPAAIGEGWETYTDPAVRRKIQELRERGRESLFARTLKQLYIVDTDAGTSRVLWNAPSNSLVDVAWSPDGRRLLIGPTFLPPSSDDAAGRAGEAVVEFDVATGSFSTIAVPRTSTRQGTYRLSWLSNERIQIDDGLTKFRFRKLKKMWRLADGATDRLRAPRIRMELRQDLNTPPALYAVDTATGQARLALDPNPSLRTDLALGAVSHINWDSAGRQWSGLLYYPVNYASDRKYPLVIQTHEHAAPHEFSLYGKGKAPGLGPGISVFAAQALANRGIAVLHIEDKNVTGVNQTPQEAEMYMAAYQAAVEQLAAQGIVERHKVGIVGYSSTGWHVEYALAHSEFPYAAAIVTDNTDASYVWAAALAWPQGPSQLNGASPFGEGLQTWLRRSPGFNAEKIRTPLRLQCESGGLGSTVLQWELFSRLRYLKRPVELFVVPDIEHGAHALQNPRQVLVMQEGAVDWFDFWLNGREDPNPAKRDQYQRWQKLRLDHDATMQRHPFRLQSSGNTE
jgi:dipeptidyl aminopeptidase/acylaminoacyl peptidase